MNTMTTRSIAALAATGAIVAGGAAAANASDATPEQKDVAQLVHTAVEDGTVTLDEEDAIKQAIEDASSIEFESLDEAAAGATNGVADPGATSNSTDVAQLVTDAIEDGTVTLDEETAIKQAIEDASGVQIESLDEVAPQG